MAKRDLKDETFSRRQFLTYRIVMDGTPIWQAIEAVSSTAMEHPDWDMDQEMTWAEWQEQEQASAG